VRDAATLLVLGTIAGAAYAAIVLAIFGREWLKRFRALVRR
jgi:hypothetical protein